MAANQGWFSDWYANGWFPDVWFAPADESGVPVEELHVGWGASGGAPGAISPGRAPRKNVAPGHFGPALTREQMLADQLGTAHRDPLPDFAIRDRTAFSDAVAQRKERSRLRKEAKASIAACPAPAQYFPEVTSLESVPQALAAEVVAATQQLDGLAKVMQQFVPAEIDTQAYYDDIALRLLLLES